MGLIFYGGSEINYSCCNKFSSLLNMQIDDPSTKNLTINLGSSYILLGFQEVGSIKN